MTDVRFFFQILFDMPVNPIVRIYVLILLVLSGCKSWNIGTIFEKEDKFSDLRTYEDDFGSRVEVFLELAKTELEENYKRKKFFMIREDQPRQVLHPRKDIFLRELINTAYKEEKISEEQKKQYFKKCDQLYNLWEMHWRKADQKARQLGLPR